MATDPSEIGENRQTALRLGPKGLAVFTKKGWNNALRESAIYAGNWWIANYGPLRWNSGYAQTNLGYPPRGPKVSMTKQMVRAMFAMLGAGRARGTTKRERMANGELPFFHSGTMRANFNSRAYTKATAKKGGVRFWIVCPVGHALRPETAAAFKTVPPAERKAVAREFRRALIQALMAQRVVAAGKAKAAADKAARVAANKAKRQAQRERAALKRNARRKVSIKPAA